MGLLETVKSPSDLKKLNIKQLEELSAEIREIIIKVAQKNGGHLASSLGAVDAIVALYYVFDFPKDKLVFDVGHQSYAHKILSERYEVFETIRMEGGLSGFPNIFESQYDSFTVGHAGTSVSASLGYCVARDNLGEDYYVISFVGDASMFNGENLEALFYMKDKPEKLLIILNDNGMSISKNKNGLYQAISKISMKKRYSNFMSFMNKAVGWNFIGKGLKKVKASFKRSLGPLSVLDKVGIKYVGAFDGHNIKLMVKLFRDFKSSPRTTLMHLKTVKGKGLAEAENRAEQFHGVGKSFLPTVNTFSDVIGGILIDRAVKNKKIVVITAGMTLGTGLTQFRSEFPSRLFDVGISEEFAVTYSSGMAIAGLKPFVCIYSTFLQRGYDQIMIDVCLQKLPVIFLIDRAGLVGSDGATHQGVYDLSYLRHIPNITIMSPKDTTELESMVDYALKLNSPVAIRYPNGYVDNFGTHTEITESSLWETVKEGCGTTILACGARMVNLALKTAEGTSVRVINARTVKPLDKQMLRSISQDNIVTLEDNSKIGGFGSAVLEFYAQSEISANVRIFGVADEFTEQASVASQMVKNGLDEQSLKKVLKI